jgi:hypothetical protein
MLSYGDLYSHLEKFITVDIAAMQVDGCDCTLKYTQEFCEDHKLDFSEVQARVEAAGGYCDCEVLLNAREKIPKDEIIPMDWSNRVRAGRKGEPSIVVEG